MTGHILAGNRLKQFALPLTVCILLAVFAASADAFSLLGYRYTSNPILWTDDILPFLSNGLTYTIDPGFMGGSPDARNAVHNAFRRWSVAGSDMYVALSNSASIPATDTLIKQLGINTALLMWQYYGIPVTVPIEGSNGLGANIDIFSKPQDFAIIVGGQTVGFSTNTLALAVPIYSGSQMISADIYFNEKFTWDTEGVFGIDIETVAVHEIGHALGLHHPNLAPPGYNFNPVTYLPETYTAGSLGSVMYSSYTGVKRDLRLEDTGGIKFLYGEGGSGPPPSKSGAIATSFQITGGTVVGDFRFINDAGGLCLFVPNSPYYNLALALYQDGLDITGPTGYMFDTGLAPSAITNWLMPVFKDIRIEFDVTLISGLAIDPGAYMAFCIEDTEYFRIGFDSLPAGLEFYEFEGSDGIQLRTDPYHVNIFFQDLPPALLYRYYSAKWVVGTDTVGASAIFLQDEYTIPEPAGIIMLLLLAPAALKLARVRKTAR